MTDHTSVIREKRGQTFWITINRPDKRNALNGDVIAGIAKGYRDAHDDKEVRVIVLTGAGDKAFCAGADLQNSGAAFAMDFSRPNVDYADLLRLSQNATKPAIARVGGVCMAGGMGLLCMTDMAVAADNVIFGLPEVKVGVFPMQVMSLLQSIAPPRLVNEWALTGEPFDAKTALAAGLLNHVVPAVELDVVRREHRLHRKPDRTAGDDRGRQGRSQGVWREAQADLAREVAIPRLPSTPRLRCPPPRKSRHCQTCHR
jgi:enoyl-CoA hydratase/carnithine racemase